MTVTVTSIGDNPQMPGAYDYCYVPDQLIAGNLKIVSASVTITGGAALPRGTVLGQVLTGIAAAPAATVGNTGNGTISGVALGTRAKVGTYTVTFTGPTAFQVINPNGAQLANGTKAGAYVDPEIGFAFAAGATAMAAGDSFTIAVAAGSGSYKACVASAVDGSQTPCAVLADFTDASMGDVNGAVYLMAEVNGNALILDPSLTLAGVTAALRPLGLFVKSAVSAADPS